MLLNYGLLLALESITENVTAQSFFLHPPAAAWPCLPAALHTDLACKSSEFVLFFTSRCCFQPWVHFSCSLPGSWKMWKAGRCRGKEVVRPLSWLLPKRERCPRQKVKCVLTKGLLDHGGWRVGMRAASSQLSSSRHCWPSTHHSGVCWSLRSSSHPPQHVHKQVSVTEGSYKQEWKCRQQLHFRSWQWESLKHKSQGRKASQKKHRREQRPGEEQKRRMIS